MTNDTELSDADLVARLPHVHVEHHDAPHHRGWFDRRLLINRCGACGTWHHPPRPMCPACWSWDVEPTPVSGSGTVHLAMLLHQGPPAPDVDYSKGPHPVVTVDLDDAPGVRYTSTVVGVDPSEVVIGLAVELDWIERHGAPFPVFRRA
jgi:uncharacterized OB-fold protein